MEEVKELLKIREKQLMHLKSEKEKALKKAPDGLLRVCNRKKRHNTITGRIQKISMGFIYVKKTSKSPRPLLRKTMIEEFFVPQRRS